MADEEKQEKGGKSKMMLFVGIGVVVLLIAVGIAAYLLGSRSAQQAPAGESAEVEDTSKAEGVGPMVDITDFIINILDKNETRYLKAAITLELENEETVVEVNERMPQIRDSILLLIGNKTFAELNDLQGKLQLRAEIIVRLNKLLKKGKVKGIYFTEFVVQ
ncbi:flagellar basal body-associated protein FliL [Desulfuromonas acetoxidans]|uniref:flagellar basal body-associated FliL family protein n=1 Tax=Desulfuromonas acetoxidans TaxID=891 RepID=UPI0015940180|nr:flagellar basal body-associated FliL family protein [Desulfuromonas acetoxidans]MBF0644984.1 flagellar basal body-associated FliL family protein [Desulfuromonas acetoxidans]NVE17693.1 flagellar basal body-associated FliL family protein [Desulfuromonas acetoxidans]